MASILANIVAALAMKLIQAMWARNDLKDTVRVEIANGALELAAKAHEWKSRAYGSVDAASRLHARDNGTITLSCDNPDADGAAPVPAVRSPRP